MTIPCYLYVYSKKAEFIKGKIVLQDMGKNKMHEEWMWKQLKKKQQKIENFKGPNTQNRFISNRYHGRIKENQKKKAKYQTAEL